MSEDKYKNKYRIPATRLHGYDYGSSGCYYVTICTQNHIHYFGEIVDETNVQMCNGIVETHNCASLRNVNCASLRNALSKKIITQKI